MKHVILITGHGLNPAGTRNDNGAQDKDTDEYTECSQVVTDAMALVAADESLNEITFTAMGVDERMSLPDKVSACEKIYKKNKYEPGDMLIVSIHMNSAGTEAARGIEAWIDKQEGTIDVATMIVDGVASATGLPVRKYPVQDSEQNRLGRLAIIDDTTAKAVLIECGFLTNELDAKYIQDNELDDNIAKGILDGIKAYAGITDKIPEGFIDVSPNEWYYDAVQAGKKIGIIEMQKSRKFRPGDIATRAEVLTMITRAVEHIERRYGSSASQEDKHVK